MGGVRGAESERVCREVVRVLLGVRSVGGVGGGGGGVGSVFLGGEEGRLMGLGEGLVGGVEAVGRGSVEGLRGCLGEKGGMVRGWFGGWVRTGDRRGAEADRG